MVVGEKMWVAVFDHPDYGVTMTTPQYMENLHVIANMREHDDYYMGYMIVQVTETYGRDDLNV